MEENVMTYEDNLKRWSLFFPKGAKQIKLLSSDKRPLKIIEERSRPINLQTTIDGENYFYHDPKDPLREAIAVIEKVDLEMCDILYVYGIGLGYIFEALKEWLKNPRHTLVFIEDQLTIIDVFLHTERAKEILAHPRVWVYYLTSDHTAFEGFIRMFAMQREKVIGLPLYQQVYNRRLQDLQTQLSFYRNLHSSDAAEYNSFGTGFFINYFHNLFAWPKAYHGDGLFKKFPSVPAIICGAGPSLAKNIDLLSTLTDHAIIFAGGTAMNVVNAKGIIPHFGIGIDPNIEHSARIIINNAFDTPFFYRSRINHEALKLVSGDLLYLSGNSGYDIADYFDKKVGIEPTNLEEGCNVINFSLDIAEKMGCNPIILVGVDLAYSDDKSYAPGLINHPIHPGKKLFRTKELT
ncbi:MAG: motility associated factor glycosyltransferase family protein, partial [Parachlamydiaceae bacterium]|nr:motility associated factor glycosyltransferase family protein [Parachlamydiaceae bacterium]